MSIARKAKRAMKKPPLSSVDKAIYVTFMFFDFSLMILLILIMGDTIPMSVAYADGTVVALDTLAFLFSLPFVWLIGMVPYALAGHAMTKKQPIFGNKRHKPSIMKPEIRMIPLMSKEFPASLTSSTKRKIKNGVITFLVLFVVFAALVPFGIYPRTVLDKNNNCITYNSFNKVTHKCNIKDADKLIIDILKSSHRKGGTYYHAELTFVFGDKSYSFREVDFGKMTSEERLNYMLKIKSMFEDDRYEITNVDLMDKLIKDNHYSEKEIKLVYELFDYTE